MTVSNPPVQEVIESFIADRKLSRRKLAFLETVYNQTVTEGLHGYSPDFCSGHTAGCLDVGGAAYVIQLVATLLDFLKPLEGPHTRLIETTEELVEAGHIEREVADAFYRDVIR